MDVSAAASASDVWRDCDGRVRSGSGRRCGVVGVGGSRSDKSERSRSRLDGEFVGGSDGKDGRDDGSDDEKSESVIDVGHVKVCAREVGYGGSRYGVGLDGGGRQGAGRSASAKLGANCNGRFEVDYLVATGMAEASEIEAPVSVPRVRFVVACLRLFFRPADIASRGATRAAL